ncbi:MAG TPA: MFS transporter [Chitinophagales bacterium]|nr:MFS transporter [Chitinophagales bacterium]
MADKKLSSSAFNTTVLVAALGYFVDIYDLQLFNIVSRESLRGIGITDPALIDKYDYVLFNWQMTGMLIGGIIWGVLGDRLGRKSVLFGSIVLYSLANIANGFVTTIEQYEIVRLLAGLGLAGELGAAITLVSEIMTKENRGYGTMIIVATGALGAVAANVISRNFEWQVSYFIGGGLGLALLALRVGTFESGMFDRVKKANVQKGNFFMLFTTWPRFFKYVCCILIGLPVWFCIGILIKFSEKFAAATGVMGDVRVGNAIMYAYIGLSFGDLVSGYLSQVLGSRKKAVLLFLMLSAVLSGVFLYVQNLSASAFYFLCFAVGTATGYWALFVTIASEQFGTNIRATVTTTVPNFVRGAVVPITLSYKAIEATDGNIRAALILGIICIGLAIVGTLCVKETFGKDLDYVETS